MAKIVRKSNKLKAECQKYKRYNIMALVAVLVCFVSFMFVGHINVKTYGAYQFLIPVIMVCFLGSGFLAAFFYNKYSIVKTGVEGEEITATVLSDLPDSYTCFFNLNVTYEGETSELDAVVVGPTGVFVIETKNMNGTVNGNYESTHWAQHKVGRRGTPYSKNFYSPVKQVGTHVYRLAHCLEDSGNRVFVNSAVFFSNPSTFVQLAGKPDSTPVFVQSMGDAPRLLEYITDRKASVSENQASDICAKLNGMV